mmetsp:Transcript_32325/g.82318  ORF Transcript_32325/g.82318 Transcript_32325/m.82318 type:complete len:368 (+) Transcript_32325:28-1131(+)
MGARATGAQTRLPAAWTAGVAGHSSSLFVLRRVVDEQPEPGDAALAGAHVTARVDLDGEVGLATCDRIVNRHEVEAAELALGPLELDAALPLLHGHLLDHVRCVDAKVHQQLVAVQVEADGTHLHALEHGAQQCCARGQDDNTVDKGVVSVARRDAGELARQHPWLHARECTQLNGRDCVLDESDFLRQLLEVQLHHRAPYTGGPSLRGRRVALHLGIDLALAVREPLPQHVAVAARYYLAGVHVLSAVLDSVQRHGEHVLHHLSVETDDPGLHLGLLDEDLHDLLHHYGIHARRLHLGNTAVDCIGIGHHQLPHLLAVAHHRPAEAVHLPLIGDLGPVDALRDITVGTGSHGDPRRAPARVAAGCG